MERLGGRGVHEDPQQITEHLHRLEQSLEQARRELGQKIDDLAGLIHGAGEQPGLKGRIALLEHRMGTVTWFATLCVGGAATSLIALFINLLFGG